MTPLLGASISSLRSLAALLFSLRWLLLHLRIILRVLSESRRGGKLDGVLSEPTQERNARGERRCCTVASCRVLDEVSRAWHSDYLSDLYKHIKVAGTLCRITMTGNAVKMRMNHAGFSPVEWANFV